MLKKSRQLIWTAASIMFFLSGNAFADTEYPKVLAVSGEAQILRPPQGWQKLEAAAVLKKGFKIKTGDNASVEITWDEGLNRVASLDENSHLDILSQNTMRLFLMRGKFFVLREDNGSLPMKIFTGDTMVEIAEGGCSIEAIHKATLVKIFSEKAKIFSLKGHRVSAKGRIAEEGFKFFSGKMDPRISSRFQRMSYGDYADWEAWVRKSYERKDDLAADAFQKGAVL